MTNKQIYHITSRADWQGAQATGSYSPASLSSEGFIHFSTREQVVTVANAFYRGQLDLVLLVVDAARLTAALRFEGPVHPADSDQPPPPQDALFPHLYGALHVDAVTQVLDFPPDADGMFVFPE